MEVTDNSRLSLGIYSFTLQNGEDRTTWRLSGSDSAFVGQSESGTFKSGPHGWQTVDFPEFGFRIKFASKVASLPNGVHFYTFPPSGRPFREFPVYITGSSPRAAFEITPNPWYSYNQDYSGGGKNWRPKFSHIPVGSLVGIYTLNRQSILQKIIWDTPWRWDLRDQEWVPVRSGIYLVKVTSPDGNTQLVKFFVVAPEDTMGF